VTTVVRETVAQESARTQPHLVDHPPHLSVVIPTFNERDNIGELLARLAPALPEYSEVIFVDDSRDDTPDVIAAAASEFPVPLRLHHRPVAEGGLGGAVVQGLRLARGTWVVVMDADLQHPPELVADLVAAGDDAEADLVVASRYAAGGSRAGLANLYRQVVSRSSTLLAKVAFPGRLRGVSDPMSGFFAVRASTLDVSELRPLGYKILLELVVRSRPNRVIEVPFAFGERFAGESKSSLREGLRYLRHLATLRLASTSTRMLAFAAIGATGVLPNLLAMQALTSWFGVHYLVAAVVANQCAIVWNFVLTDTLVFGDRRRRRLAGRFARFAALNNVDLIARVPMLAILVGEFGLGYLTATAITLCIMAVARFAVLDRLIYVRTRDVRPPAWDAL
jgi:dolichol-phosphate mannosyltransferase